MSADRVGLRTFGLIFGGVTAAVMLTAFTVVVGHIEGRFTLDAPTTITMRQ
jgi:Flp pilus assembly pilin Flp